MSAWSQKFSFLIISVFLGTVVYVFCLSESGCIQLRSLQTKNQNLKEDIRLLQQQNYYLHQKYYTSKKTKYLPKDSRAKGSPHIIFKYYRKKKQLKYEQMSDFFLIHTDSSFLKRIRTLYFVFLGFFILFVYFFLSRRHQKTK